MHSETKTKATGSKANRLSSPMTKEEVYAFIDDYFREDQAAIALEVSPEEIRSAVGADLSRHSGEIANLRNEVASAMRSGSKAAEQAEQALAKAQAALEAAQRKSGGSFVVKVERKDAPAVTIKNPHKQFADLLRVLSAGCHAYLVGPAGSGKSTAAQQCAEALGLSFHFTGAIASEFKLTGFIDARGTYQTTEFRKAYENGGVFLFDEIDASAAAPVLCFNAALANGHMDFPDRTVKRHKDFYCIAAANTYGQGASREYVGRNQLDAASLDRFVFILWDYDEDLEARLAANPEWVAFVQRVRRAVENLKIRAVISPRASIYGSRLLSSGVARESVENLTIWKGMDSATIAKIRAVIA